MKIDSYNYIETFSLFYFFSILEKLFFSFSCRFLYCSQPFCCFFSFSFLERLEELSRAFSVVFLSCLIIFSWWIFTHFCIDEKFNKRITKKIDHEENYYRPVRVGNFWSNNCIEYGSKGDRNKKLSVEEYLNEIRPYLKYIINDLKKFDT